MKAAVQAANDGGTYVSVHVYSSAAIPRALDAGVKSIEHGHLADEATIKLIGEKGLKPFLGDGPLLSSVGCSPEDNLHTFVEVYLNGLI